MNFTKKLLLTTTLFATFSIPAKAATIEFTIGDINFKTESDYVVTDHVLEAAPFINENNRTMVPIRAVSEAFGASVSWDEPTRTVTVTNADNVIKLTIDNTTAFVNETAVTLDCTPVIINERTFVPIRFITEALSYNVNFATTTKQIVIDDSPVILQCGNKTASFAKFHELYSLFYSLGYDDAIASGMTEEEIFNNAASSALNSLAIMLRVQNAFPSVPLSEDDCKEIQFGIENTLKEYTPVLTGITNVVIEENYFSVGSPIFSYYADTMDTDSIYNSEYVCAKHILVTDESLAKNIYDSLKKGADFDEAVKEHGTDPGMVSNPNGYIFTKGEMVKEFETAAFALKANDFSEPVKSMYGYHIIKRELLPDITPEKKLAIATAKANEDFQNSEIPKFLITEEELISMLPRG